MFDALAKPEFAAFANHLVFLARHRGTLRVEDDGYWIDGACPALSCWIPGPGVDRLPASCSAVRLAPWTEKEWSSMLVQAGYAAAERLTYLELERLVPVERRVDAAVSIDFACDAAGLREFAAVQAAGFATGRVDIDAWWEPFFLRVALANQCEDDQTFYLARVDGRAASTTLAVRGAGVTGIYAVATRPEHRCRGLAHALLERAATDSARTHGLERVILQAMTGSYPETYYRKLGFRSICELQVWRLKDAAP